MIYNKSALIFLVPLSLACGEQKQSRNQQEIHIDPNTFQHHYIEIDLPGTTGWGYGCPAMADFDNDGDLDYAFSGAEGLYWFENQGNSKWERHEVGIMPIKNLGATSFDVDNIGREHGDLLENRTN